MQKFTLRDLLTRFGTVEQCLAFIKEQRWPDEHYGGGIPCKKCERVTPHHMIPSRKCYSCQNCGSHVHPTAGTIFERSRVPLPDWFYVIFQFAKTRAGFSAKQVERELGVSYPTALRMCNLIRSQLGESPTLSGIVEADETYIGGKPRIRGVSKRGRGTRKVPVIGAVQRDGKIVVKAVDNVKRETVIPWLKEHIKEGAEVYTDELNIYDVLPEEGYEHEKVLHKQRQYARITEDGKNVHTNHLEGFWSYPKSAVLRIHRGVSRRKLQGYLNEHAFRYNHRKDADGLFCAMLTRASSEVAPLAQAR
ncbi:MAG: IS1595 family transposase [Bacteroidota bacterium]